MGLDGKCMRVQAFEAPAVPERERDRSSSPVSERSAGVSADHEDT